MHLDGLAHMTIPVRDLDRSVDFYADVLGMRLTQYLPGPRMAFFDVGGDCVILAQVDTDISTAHEFAVHHAFRVAHDRYDAAVAELVEHGVEIIRSEDMRGNIVNGPRTYFCDPDGNQLEIIDLTEYRRIPIVATLPAGRVPAAG